MYRQVKTHSSITEFGVHLMQPWTLSGTTSNIQINIFESIETLTLTLADCQWINNRSEDFNKMENCPYMREGEGSILIGTNELNKILEVDIFVSLRDNSAHKRAGKLKV